MCRDIDAFIRNAPCAFNYIIYPIFAQCYIMGRFGHENGPFWMLAGAVLVMFFSSIGGRFGRGRFRPSLGPFWRWAILVGSRSSIQIFRLLTNENSIYIYGIIYKAGTIYSLIKFNLG